jgi:murein DD-endopeptidase MepM/ murein hydrolase activator NlpD
VGRQLGLAVILVLAAAAGFALAVEPGPQAAFAHTSDCHDAQTCPSDDGNYAWLDPTTGLTWICFSRNPADAAQADATEIVHEEVVYACWAVEPPTTTTATTETVTEIAPVETAPVDEEPVVTIPEVDEDPLAATALGPVKAAAAERAAASGRPPRPRRKAIPPVLMPPGGIVPRLTQRGYVFPVYGPAAFADTFGAGRAVVGWHHGEDVFAPLGAPILAVADGTVFSVGWNDLGGNRLWLRDEQGNEFYYAHLAAFSPLAVDGAHVRAGAVLGFVGNTGDAETTPTHLHFEIHPVGLLALGYDGVVAPYPYLVAWKRLDDLPFSEVGLSRVGWTSYAPTSVAAPTPGALLLSSTDISTASSLDAGELRRALADEPALPGSSPLAGTPAAGPPVAELTRRPGESLLEELRRRAEDAAADSSSAAGIWDALALCEAGARWSYDGSSGFEGGLQFHPATWTAYRLPDDPEHAWEATREEQIAVARRVLAEQGWRAWPVCSRRLGLR